MIVRQRVPFIVLAFGLSAVVMLVTTNVMVAHADFQLCKDCLNSKHNHSDNGGSGGSENSGSNGGDTSGGGGSDSGGGGDNGGG